LEDKIEKIAKKIYEQGGKIYLVGGAIRDEILRREIHDKDYCVVGISSDKFQEIFPEARKQGKMFEVFCIDNTQFAMARKETKKGTGHKGFEIETGENISIEEDLKRRDITINSIAKDVLTGEIIDPFDGIKDIQNRIIKATSEAFKEDPLRVYRVARFSSELDFDVEDRTIEMMESLKSELNSLSEERVFVEFKKALVSNKPSNFFQVLRKANILDVHFKEIYDLIDSIQPEKYHPEGDSYNHTMIVVDKSVELTEKLEIRFACLVHDLGKGITPREMMPHHYGHDAKGVRLVENFCRRLKIPNSWLKCGKVSAKEHMRGGTFNKMTIPKQIDYITNVDKSLLGLDGMEIVVMCDKFRDNKLPEDIVFSKIGKECLKQINGKYIKEKYDISEANYTKFKELLKKERIEWLKIEKNVENINLLV